MGPVSFYMPTGCDVFAKIGNISELCHVSGTGLDAVSMQHVPSARSQRWNHVLLRITEDLCTEPGNPRCRTAQGTHAHTNTHTRK